MIGIALDRDRVEPGDFLTGSVRWSDEAIRRVIVVAEWQTDGKGNRASGIARIVQIPARGSERQAPFRMRIPFEGPITFAGELISVSWRVRAHVDRRGPDESMTADFTVALPAT
jgi:hypothetical protein